MNWTSALCITLLLNVDTPRMLSWFPKNVLFWVVIPINVDIPETLNCVANNVLCCVVIPTKVETPDIFKVCDSVFPKTVTPIPTVLNFSSPVPLAPNKPTYPLLPGIKLIAV